MLKKLVQDLKIPTRSTYFLIQTFMQKETVSTIAITIKSNATLAHVLFDIYLPI